MSALSPANKKYRRSWLTWGQQAVPSKDYLDNYDKIQWGEIDGVEKEELSSPSHYKIRIKSSGQ